MRRVDQHALKTGQALTISLLILAFVLNHPALSPLLVAFVGLAQFAGALALPFAPYKLIYQGLVLPTGLIQPRPEPDNPEPHRFALLVGTLFNLSATVALLANLPVIGWLLVAVVVVLANLNFWLNFCAGCWMYYQLNRFGVPGFTKAPVRKAAAS